MRPASIQVVIHEISCLALQMDMTVKIHMPLCKLSLLFVLFPVSKIMSLVDSRWWGNWAAVWCDLRRSCEGIYCEIINVLIVWWLSYVIINFPYFKPYVWCMSGIWQLLRQVVIHSFGPEAKRSDPSTRAVFDSTGFSQCLALLIQAWGFHEYCTVLCSMVNSMLCAVYPITSWIIDEGYGRGIPHIQCGSD